MVLLKIQATYKKEKIMISTFTLFSIFSVVLCGFQAAFANLQSLETKNQVSQHTYVDGEVLEYLFEDTESTFDTVKVIGLEQPKNLILFQELRIPLKIRIFKTESGILSRRLQFYGASYRSAAPKDFNTTVPVPLEKIIPNFPANFGYVYKNDPEAIGITAEIYKPYMKDEVGQFVYFKELDVHTIQGVIDNIPKTLKVGEIIQKPGQEIKLPQGVFHNADTTILYSGIETIDNIRCGYFKVVTMGNSFPFEAAGKLQILFTNYQYGFYVPLEGALTGLLYRGELQETVTVPGRSIIQRQFSMKLINRELTKK